MKNLISIPYKIMAIILVGSAIVLGLVLAVGVPANLITLFK